MRCSVTPLGRRRGCSSDQRGQRLAVTLEFYRTDRAATSRRRRFVHRPPDRPALESIGLALEATSRQEGAMADVAGEHRDPGLRRGVGFSGVLFQSITFMAPAIATAFSIPAGIAFSGGGAPLSVIFALVASLLAAVSIGQLSKHMPTAGSFYTYVSNGLHPALGFLVGWGFLLGILVGGPFLALQMGFVVAGTTNSEWGWSAGPVVGLDRARLPARVLAGLPRHQGVDRDRNPARCLRDPRVRRAGTDTHRPGRQRQHARGVRHAIRQQPRLLRLLRGDRGLDLHHPRVHRFRGGGADRGRGARAATERQPGDHLLLPGDRPLLHPQHLRQHHHVRTRADDRLRRCR